MMKRLFRWEIALLALILTLLAAACTPLTPANGTTTPRGTEKSPTPVSSQTSLPSPTLLPPSPTATLNPVAGTVTAQVNVRNGPNVSYSSIGILDSDEKIQIIGKDTSESWFLILYPSGPEGRGWVMAVYIQAGDTAGLPVVDIQGAGAHLAGKATQLLNVRNGPGTEYKVLGIIQPDAVLMLTGRNADGTWLQVEYAVATDGRGWVTAAYVQADDTASLPVLNASGISEAILRTPVSPLTPGASGPTSQPATFTPTLGPANADDDSSAAPAFQVVFSPLGTGQFSYSSDISSPQGDVEDWITFTPYAALADSPARLLFSLDCDGNGHIEVELWQNGAPLAGWGMLSCGDQDLPLDLVAGTPHQLRLRAATGEGLQYIRYTLTVRNLP